jgi:hypothetical protein
MTLPAVTTPASVQPPTVVVRGNHLALSSQAIAAAAKLLLAVGRARRDQQAEYPDGRHSITLDGRTFTAGRVEQAISRARRRK